MDRKKLDELYEKRKGDVKCISVLYHNDLPIIYAINGDDEDLSKGKTKKVREDIYNILGIKLDPATIDDSFSIFSFFGRNKLDVIANRHEIDLAPSNGFSHIKKILTNEKINFTNYTDVKTKINPSNEKGFYTCAERKILGALPCCYFYNFDNYELYSVAKLCVLCEPVLHFAYYLDDSSGYPILKHQHVDIITKSPFLEYFIYERDL